MPNGIDCEDSDAGALILEAVEKKRRKGGAAYAAGKTLVVFLNAKAGAWHPSKVARQLPEPLYFAALWVVSLQTVKAGEYTYAVTQLDANEDNAPTLLVRINNDFSAWEVTRIQ